MDPKQTNHFNLILRIVRQLKQVECLNAKSNLMIIRYQDYNARLIMKLLIPQIQIGITMQSVQMARYQHPVKEYGCYATVTPHRARSQPMVHGSLLMNYFPYATSQSLKPDRHFSKRSYTNHNNKLMTHKELLKPIISGRFEVQYLIL